MNETKDDIVKTMSEQLRESHDALINCVLSIGFLNPITYDQQWVVRERAIDVLKKHGALT